MNLLPIVDRIDAWMCELRSLIRTTTTEPCEFEEALGRVLAEPIAAMFDSPSADVSAMDGYALRWSDVSSRNISVVGTVAAGRAPISLPSGSAVRIFTGAVIPAEAELVVQREYCLEHGDSIELQCPLESLRKGQNIRKRGENARAGDSVLSAGQLIRPQTMAGIASFAHTNQLTVYRRVRVCIINTGDELISLGESCEPWQIRDSNGPMLEAMLSPFMWVHVSRMRVRDTLESIEQAIRNALVDHDAILITGGVSMGDLDFVPQAIERVGGKIIFHRIPIRPGKPMLGAATDEGKLLLGLPGNPLSVATTFRRYGLSLLQSIAGIAEQEVAPIEKVQCEDEKKLDLLWFRLVKRRSDGVLVVASSQGSGDVASLAKCDGFVEIPPGQSASGEHRFYRFG
ncbi:MAG: molybdopterin molybdotransferase MoeA [Pirellula sp.]|jgi:molybdopterin molybdotransferase|nr:molybdopterin molybdotransferase MoeA [Pirellula sp.]